MISVALISQTAAIPSWQDEQEGERFSATCPFCLQTAIWNAARRALVSNCPHLRAKTRDGAFIFHAEGAQHRPEVRDG